ncbi:hypothetical protein [Alloalcanivorax mobilis]|uniref:hypothetical protein n=1 Tax=Alloalcanivorax mobilis TaxID=2019569 RepID=UPI0012FFF28F|nr:hypothetical protein [Alloalcanivorax mobilis]
MWPIRVELSASRYPVRLRRVALAITGVALMFSALPLSVAALAGLAAMALARRWRLPLPRAVEVAPQGLRLELADRRRLQVSPPFRVLMRPGWLALHCPDYGWVWLFADQGSAAALTPLRQVLWMQRSR